MQHLGYFTSIESWRNITNPVAEWDPALLVLQVATFLLAYTLCLLCLGILTSFYFLLLKRWSSFPPLAVLHATNINKGLCFQSLTTVLLPSAHDLSVLCSSPWLFQHIKFCGPKKYSGKNLLFQHVFKSKAFFTVVSYKSEIFSLKWQLPTCSHPHSSTPLFWRKEGAKQAVLISMKNSHFNRTPLYQKCSW